MVVTRAPLRISFVGGGTDIPYFYEKYDGGVVSATINKYVTVNAMPSSQRHTENPYIRECLRALDMTAHVNFTSDVEHNTGLGGSSAFLVGVLKALHELKGTKYPKAGKQEQLAQEAYHIERERLGNPVGKQDHYAAAYTGFNHFTFRNNGSVGVHPINKSTLELQKHLLLVDTGKRRSASAILDRQENTDPSLLLHLKSLVDPFISAFMYDNFEYMGRLVSEGWDIKRGISTDHSGQAIDEMYADGIAAGAYGGKLLGAGGGGYILFIAPPESHETIIKRLTDRAPPTPFSFV